jgi:PhzF family phenazine biosynthesis protein
MKTRPFKQVDVFTDTPYLGNPLAVVLDGAGLSTDEMQHFAHWTNLSETTFLLPPTPEAAAAGADYQVRIFTTAYEMPFAGHPTLGSCHAWLEAGGQPKHHEFIVQQCPVGLVRIRRSGQQLAFAAPPLTRRALDAKLLTTLLAALSLRPEQVLASQHLINGPHFIGLLLDQADTVLAVQAKLQDLRECLGQVKVGGVGLAALDGNTSDSALIKRSNREARAFASPTDAAAQTARLTVRFLFDSGVTVLDDPVTGSFNASLAQWLIADGLAPAQYLATQGTCLGRLGQVHISQDATGQVWVGGDCVTCIDGTVRL